METVKKNLFSIIFGVIALIAVVAFFYPVGSMYDDTQTALNTRKKDYYDDVSRVRDANRSWPVIPNLVDLSAPKLQYFPSQPYIVAGRVIKTDVSAQAQSMKDETATKNVHALLVEGVLPVPSADSGFRFQTAYLDQVQRALPTALIAATPGAPVLAGMPPSDADVHAEADRLWKVEFEPQIYRVAGEAVNLQKVQADWQKRCETLQPSLRLRRGHDIKLYLEPQALSINAKLLDKSGAAPVTKDIWYAQVMYWVEKDVAAGIIRANDPFPNVIAAPIKHIYRFEVPEKDLYVMGGGGGGSQAAPEPVGKVYTRTVTGRICNGGADGKGYDVVQFGLIMDVEASKLPAVLVELQRGNWITLRQCDVQAVDAVALEDEGFIYGDVPVVRVTILGEELLLRSWTVGEKNKDGTDKFKGIMPPDIKKELGVQ